MEWGEGPSQGHGPGRSGPGTDNGGLVVGGEGEEREGRIERRIVSPMGIGLFQEEFTFYCFTGLCVHRQSISYWKSLCLLCLFAVF